MSKPSNHRPLNVYFSNLSPQKIDTAVDWQLSFAKRYQENDFDFIWLVFSSRFNDLFRDLREKGLHIEIVPPRHTKGMRLVLFLLKFIIDKKVDIMHMHFIRPWNAILLIMLSKLLFQETIFIYHKRSPGKLISKKFNIKRYVNPLSIMSIFVDKIVCNSDSIVSNCINRGVSRKKPVRIYNGIRTERFQYLRDTGRIRKEFQIPPDYRLITSIKYARPEFGLKDLLNSIPLVLSTFPKTMFLIVGGGVETERLKCLAKELKIENNVIFAGIRNDVPDIIAESYFTIDPCPVEAFGNVIVESMAGRKPVIGVNAFGPKEIIVHGETGILVDPYPPIDFSKAIIELLSSPGKVKEMGEKSYERARKYFTVEKMVSETVKLSMELMHG